MDPRRLVAHRRPNRCTPPVGNGQAKGGHVSLSYRLSCLGLEDENGARVVVGPVVRADVDEPTVWDEGGQQTGHLVHDPANCLLLLL